MHTGGKCASNSDSDKPNGYKFDVCEMQMVIDDLYSSMYGEYMCLLSANSYTYILIL